MGAKRKQGESSGNQVTPGHPAYPAAQDPGRSRNMRAIRRTDTRPEVALRSQLHRLGYRFRKDHRLDLGDVKVRPDIVFTKRKVAVFVDGCFWHVCPIHGRRPSVNEWYWDPKLSKNVERDRRSNEALEKAGWAVVRIWEHETIDGAVNLIEQALRPSSEADSTLSPQSPHPSL
ncbi:very short patch repair endonuclease [Rhodococcus sp. NPDC003383]